MKEFDAFEYARALYSGSITEDDLDEFTKEQQDEIAFQYEAIEEYEYHRRCSE